MSSKTRESSKRKDEEVAKLIRDAYHQPDGVLQPRKLYPDGFDFKTWSDFPVIEDLIKDIDGLEPTMEKLAQLSVLPTDVAECRRLLAAFGHPL